MNLAGLSLERSPPLSVPLRFFFTAPLFGLGAALLLLLGDPLSFSMRWTPVTLALTHLLTLGVLGMVMSGALMQLLPVVAGVAIWRVRMSAWVIHLSLALGTLALAAGLLSGKVLWLHAALALLGLWGGWLVLVVVLALWRAHTAMATVWTLRAAIAALGMTAGLGLWLALNLSQGVVHLNGVDVHAQWGLGGWVLLLISGVAYQVVPLFQVTPNYPLRFMRWFAPLVLTLLAGSSVAQLWGSAGLGRLAQLGLLGALLVFALATLLIQARRKRHLTDASLWFWRLGLGSLVLSTLVGTLLVLGFWVTLPGMTVAVGVVFILGFSLSVISAMLYKIVPFLTWLQLNNQVFAHGVVSVSVPHMKAIISEAAARRHLYLHSLMLLAMAVAPLHPGNLTRLAALSLGGVFALWLWNLLGAFGVYRRTLALIRATPG